MVDHLDTFGENYQLRMQNKDDAELMQSYAIKSLLPQ